MQVRREHGPGAVDIARKNPLGQTIVCRDKLLAAIECPHHNAAIAICLIVEIGMCRKQPLRFACRQQRGMEGLVKSVEIRRTLAEVVAGSLDMSAHLMQRAEDSRL